MVESLNLNLTGTAGILWQARKVGAIPQLTPVLNDLVKRGFLLSKKIFGDALRQVGETE
jgi:predicted nucleic acid-binding protein